MPEKMLKQIKRRSKISSSRKPHIAQHDLMRHLQDTHQSPANLTAQHVLQLQRMIGNHAVNQLLHSTDSPTLQRTMLNNPIALNGAAGTIQRDQYDSPVDFTAWFRTQEIYTKWLSNRGGDCAPSTKEIGAFLEDMFEDHDDVTVQYRGISFLTPFGHPAANNMPHFVVTVSWGSQTVVIDPTQEQFAGGVNQITDNGAWEAGFAALPTRFSNPDFEQVAAVTPKVYSDFNSFADANAFVSGNIYKTSDDNKPVGREIGAWVNPRVPYVKAGTPPPKKKGFLSNIFSKK